MLVHHLEVFVGRKQKKCINTLIIDRWSVPRQHMEQWPFLLALLLVVKFRPKLLNHIKLIQNTVLGVKDSWSVMVAFHSSRCRTYSNCKVVSKTHRHIISFATTSLFSGCSLFILMAKWRWVKIICLRVTLARTLLETRLCQNLKIYSVQIKLAG